MYKDATLKKWIKKLEYFKKQLIDIQPDQRNRTFWSPPRIGDWENGSFRSYYTKILQELIERDSDSILIKERSKYKDEAGRIHDYFTVVTVQVHQDLYRRNCDWGNFNVMLSRRYNSYSRRDSISLPILSLISILIRDLKKCV